MNENAAERKLKAELDFFKVYAVFIIGLVTGDVNLFLKFMDEATAHILILLLFGMCVLLVVLFFFMKSFNTINKLTKNK